MLRIIVRDDDSFLTVNAGAGKALVPMRTFDVELPEVEAFLREYEDSKSKFYWQRQVIGVEILRTQSGTPCP